MDIIRNGIYRAQSQTCNTLKLKFVIDFNLKTGTLLSFLYKFSTCRDMLPSYNPSHTPLKIEFPPPTKVLVAPLASCDGVKS